jgi:Signal peptidase (SPase) II
MGRRSDSHMKAASRLVLMACVLVGCVGCDQISKAAARAYLPGTAVLLLRLDWVQRACIAVIGASGAANLIDRIRFNGAVTDFLNLGVGSVRTGIFNVADVTLIIGVLGLLLAPHLRRSRTVGLR